MSAALIAALTVIAQIASSLGTSSSITAIINFLIQILPTLVQEVEDVVPIVKNIINSLKSNTAITPEQLDQLAALEVQYDAAFEKESAGFNPDGSPV